MNRLVLGMLVMGAFAASLSAQSGAAQADSVRPKLRLERADRAEIIGTGKNEVYHAQGGVVFVQGPSTLRCEKARFHVANEVVHLERDVFIEDTDRSLEAAFVEYHGKTREEWARGGVRLQSGRHTLNADQVHYRQEPGQANAQGHVVLRDLIERAELKGREAFYDRPKGYGRVTGSPFLTRVDTTGQDTLRVWGLTMEAWSDSQKVVITDSVRIAQGALKAHCRRATYWGQTGRLLLEFSPIVWQEAQEMQADTIDMAIAKGKLQSGLLKGHAQVTSTDTSDQGSMTGRTIHFGAEQDSLRKVWITGQATNVYHVPEAEETPGVNTFTGDRILLVFKGKRLQRVQVLSDPGLSTGKFTPEKTSPAKPKEEKAQRGSSG